MKSFIFLLMMCLSILASGDTKEKGSTQLRQQLTRDMIQTVKLVFHSLPDEEFSGELPPENQIESDIADLIESMVAEEPSLLIISKEEAQVLREGKHLIDKDDLLKQFDSLNEMKPSLRPSSLLQHYEILARGKGLKPSQRLLAFRLTSIQIVKTAKEIERFKTR